jgi:hypothetical protein
MTDTQIHGQYSTGLSRRSIAGALVAAGLDPDHLRTADLAMLEDFHTMGRIATSPTGPASAGKHDARRPTRPSLASNLKVRSRASRECCNAMSV